MSAATPTPVPPTTTDLPLLAGRYQLLDKLGEGGMGIVFRARDTTLNRLIAVKVLPSGKLQDAEAVARFRREALALAKLSHPHIIQAYDSGQDGDKHFLVMELVEGRSLAAELAEKGRLAPTRAADYVRQAALALHHAHQFRLVHRDVKPSNLLLGPDGRIRLLDLGLARFLQDQLGDATLTRAGTAMGTPDYCSPEQFHNAHKADVRSDIYSLGCTLYHLIAGKPPFPGSSLSEKARAHEMQQPPPLEDICPDIPGGLPLVLARMLAKRPADRFASMAEVAEALMPYVAGSSASFRDLAATVTWNGGQLETMTAHPRRRMAVPWLVAGAAMLLALLAVVGLSYVWLHGGGTQAAQRHNDPADSDSPPAQEEKQAEKSPEGTRKEPAKVVEAEEANVLTVSQKPEHGGRFRAINEALAEVRPGQTIRVLDDAVYQESLLLNHPSAHNNITLEAARDATLEMSQSRGALIQIVGVSGVTVRNFRLRGQNTEMTAFLYIRENGAGALLERLDMAPGAGKGGFNGVEVQQVRASPDANRPQVTIHDCVIRKAQIGINLMGVSDGYRDPTPIHGLQMRNNRFLDCQWGVTLKGSLRRVQVVGNRFHGCIRAAWQLENLLEDSDDILIANNTAFECNNMFRVWDDKIRTKGVRLANNLALGGPYPDTLVFDSGGNPAMARGYGDGADYPTHWTFSHNWREVKAPLTRGKKPDGWIPPGEKDVCKERIDGLNRDPKSHDFLRPAKDSPLAEEGAGKEDPLLPHYIGALPPEGVQPWDWERTWRVGAKPDEK